MTYTEKNNEESFDWNAFLNKKEITQNEWEYASLISSQWVTCACGNQCDLIPRYQHNESSFDSKGTPKDNILRALGLEFNELIRLQNIGLSKLVLATIEKRSAFILANL